MLCAGALALTGTLALTAALATTPAAAIDKPEDERRSIDFHYSNIQPESARVELLASGNAHYSENLASFDVLWESDGLYFYGDAYSVSGVAGSQGVFKEAVRESPENFTMQEIFGSPTAPVGQHRLSVRAFDHSDGDWEVWDTGFVYLKQFPASVPGLAATLTGCATPAGEPTLNPEPAALELGPDLSGDLDIPALWEIYPDPDPAASNPVAAWAGSWELTGPRPASGTTLTVPAETFEALPDGDYTLTPTVQGTTEFGTVIGVDYAPLAFSVETPAPEIAPEPGDDPTAITATPKYAAPETLIWELTTADGAPIANGEGADIPETILAELTNDTYVVTFTESHGCKTAQTSAEFAVTLNPILTPGELRYGKRVAASATPTIAGSTLDFTIDLANVGEQPVAVALRDVLADVNDDAIVDPSSLKSSSPELTAALSADGSHIEITGELAGEAKATVTYRATVLPEKDRGNSVAVNHVVPADGEDPAVGTVCAPDSGTCTSTPLSPDPAAPKPDPDPDPDPEPSHPKPNPGAPNPGTPNPGTPHRPGVGGGLAHTGAGGGLQLALGSGLLALSGLAFAGVAILKRSRR